MNQLNFIGPPGAVIIGLMLGLVFFYGVVKIQSLTQGVVYAFSKRRLFLAFLFFLFTFPLTWPVFPTSWNIEVPYLVNALFLAVNVLLFLAAFRAPCLYCAECGTYIGTKPSDCPDCGCETHTKINKETCLIKLNPRKIAMLIENWLLSRGWYI